MTDFSIYNVLLSNQASREMRESDLPQENHWPFPVKMG